MKNKFKILFLLFLLMLGNNYVMADDNKYLFYMHGYRLESLDDDHKRAKAYRTIVSSLEDSGFNVISEQRGETSVIDYGIGIANEVKKLLADGVKPQNITVAGFSKGAAITLIAAGQVQNPNVNFIALAGCSDYFHVNYKKLQGRILSIYDVDDDKYFPCDGKISNEQQGVTFKEVSIESGKGHKVFRKKKEKWIELWRDPMMEWIGQ